MTTFADPAAAIDEADYLATLRDRKYYLIDAGNQQIEVRTHYTPEDTILETVRPAA